MKKSFEFLPVDEPKERRRREYAQRHRAKHHQDHGGPDNTGRGFRYANYFDDVAPQVRRSVDADSFNDGEGGYVPSGEEHRIHKDELTFEQLWNIGLNSIDSDGYLRFSPGGTERIDWDFDGGVVTPPAIDSSSIDDEPDEDDAEFEWDPRGLEFEWMDVAYALNKQNRQRARRDIIEKQYQGTTEEDLPDYLDGFSIKYRP